MLFEAHFTKLAGDQLFTALAWGIAALQDEEVPPGVCLRAGLFTKNNAG